MSISDPALVPRVADAVSEGNITHLALQLGVRSNVLFRWRKGRPMSTTAHELLSWIADDPDAWRARVEARTPTQEGR